MKKFFITIGVICVFSALFSPIGIANTFDEETYPGPRTIASSYTSTVL